MLSTSNKTKFQYQYLLVAVVILVMLSVIALYQSGVMPTISVGQAPAAVDLSWPSRPDFSNLNEVAIIPITGNADGLAIYHQSERAALVAVQNSLAQYYLSERGTFATAQNGMSIYHQSEWNASKVSAFHNVESARWMGAALASQAQATEPQFSNVESARWMGAALASQAQATELRIRNVESARWMGAALASQVK
jgi:hypothetical protein